MTAARRERVLIFQIGSLGDTVIALPAYREVERRHPGAEIHILTNVPQGSKMVAAEVVLGNTGLVSGTIHYPMPLRSLSAARKLYKDLRELRPDILYYLSPERTLANLIRHYAFFRIAGITRIAGIPWSRALRQPIEVQPGERWESEGSRLLRAISPAREAGPPPDEDRDLKLTHQERSAARRACSELRDFVAVSVGGKVPVNNWGDANWEALLESLSRHNPGLGLLLVGSADERPRNDALAARWRGPSLNSCGKYSPRETAALIEQARLFIGHDTGTLNLAAAVRTPIVGVYSGRHVPGKWFSDRPADRFIYHKTDCFDCECFEVSECRFNRKCIESIQPDEVLEAVQSVLDSRVESLRT